MLTELSPQVIAAAQRYDAQALEALYKCYYDPIYRYMVYRCGDPTEAQDLTQAVFLGVLRRISLFKAEEAKFSSWIFKIAANIATDHYRKWKNFNGTSLDEQAESLASPAPGPAQTFTHRQNQIEITEALRQLPEAHQQVLLLRFVSQISIKETAEVLGRTPGAIKQLQLRALASLGEMVSPNSLEELSERYNRSSS